MKKKINKKEVIFHIVTTSLLSALIFVVTFFIKIPYANGAGYLNFSDALILFGVAFFSPLEGIIGGIVGSCLADLVSGYSAFIPFTILAKGLEGLACWLLLFLLKKFKIIKNISFIISPFVMVLVYFITYIILYGFEYACVSSVFDIIQAVSCGALSIFLLLILKKAHPKFLKNYYYIDDNLSK